MLTIIGSLCCNIHNFFLTPFLYIYIYIYRIEKKSDRCRRNVIWGGGGIEIYRKRLPFSFFLSIFFFFVTTKFLKKKKEKKRRYSFLKKSLRIYVSLQKSTPSAQYSVIVNHSVIFKIFHYGFGVFEC